MNALTDAEREQVLQVLNSAQLVDAAPAQIYAAVGSGRVGALDRDHVPDCARAPARTRPELVADAPRQVYA